MQRLRTTITAVEKEDSRCGRCFLLFVLSSTLKSLSLPQRSPHRWGKSLSRGLNLGGFLLDWCHYTVLHSYSVSVMWKMQMNDKSFSAGIVSLKFRPQVSVFVWTFFFLDLIMLSTRFPEKGFRSDSTPVKTVSHRFRKNRVFSEHPSTGKDIF